MNIRRFQELTTQEKINFFLHGQTLLTTYHPTSEFIFRRSNIKERTLYIKELVTKYKGLCYSDENILVLFNKVFVANTHDPVVTLKDHMYKEPNEAYNAVSIDFVVFRHLKDCEAWIRSNYDPRIRFVVYVKNGTPQIFATPDLIARVLHLPISAPPNL